MKKVNFDFLPPRLRLWAPPLIGIPAMLLLGAWSEAARFLLFTHHLFWMASIILLINPVAETVWPGTPRKRQIGRVLPQPSSKARKRAEVRKHGAKQPTTLSAETLTTRLACLQQQKEVLDQEIEKLSAKDKGRR